MDLARRDGPRRTAIALALAVLCGGCSVSGGGSSSTPAGEEAAARATARPSAALAYPAARRADVVDVLHGVAVSDPYRWLEDPDSPESRAWIDEENRITEAWLEAIPDRSDVRERLTELWNTERQGLPLRKGGRYFFTRNDGLQNQDVLCVADEPDAAARVLLDPNELSSDGTVALGPYSPSEDGQYLAYALSGAGSDWLTWKVRDVRTGEDLPDTLRWSKFSGASWSKDGRGFYYSRYDEPPAGQEYEHANYYQKLVYHLLGTDQSEDLLVYERPDRKEWGFSGRVTHDGRHLLIHVWEGSAEKNGIFYRDLSLPDTPVVELLGDFDARYGFVESHGGRFLFLTDRAAPRGRVVAIDPASPEPSAWSEIVEEAEETLVDVELVGGRLVAAYLKDAHSVVRVFDTAGGPLRELELPGLGSVSGFGGEPDNPETFFSFTSFATPPSVFRHDVATGKTMLHFAPRMGFQPKDYVTRQVFYESKDGTRVPLFITERRDADKDRPRRTILYGYGGFNIPLTPRFSVARLVWMETGGAYAVPNLRGGGEYGEEWHSAGQREKKQNVFDDFIAAAEWLIERGVTRRDLLAIEGRSNGGLLVGACVVQRPDLFGACLPGVGVLDMLRYDQFTIGWAWRSEYGSSEDPDDFRVLRAYSPYHNVREGVCYPPTLITTADHDDRVVPAHSFKFAAALQHAQGCGNPILIRIDRKAGHGSGKPVTKEIEEEADKIAFVLGALGRSQ